MENMLPLGGTLISGWVRTNSPIDWEGRGVNTELQCIVSLFQVTVHGQWIAQQASRWKGWLKSSLDTQSKCSALQMCNQTYKPPLSPTSSGQLLQFTVCTFEFTKGMSYITYWGFLNQIQCYVEVNFCSRVDTLPQLVTYVYTVHLPDLVWSRWHILQCWEQSLWHYRTVHIHRQPSPYQTEGDQLHKPDPHTPVR